MSFGELTHPPPKDWASEWKFIWAYGGTRMLTIGMDEEERHAFRQWLTIEHDRDPSIARVKNGYLSIPPGSKEAFERWRAEDGMPIERPDD